MPQKLTVFWTFFTNMSGFLNTFASTFNECFVLCLPSLYIILTLVHDLYVICHYFIQYHIPPTTSDGSQNTWVFRCFSPEIISKKFIHYPFRLVTVLHY